MLKQAACLDRLGGGHSVAFIVGATPEVPTAVPAHVVPGLDYDSFSGMDASDLEAGARSLAEDLETALRAAFPAGCDLLHVHNPLLRKNARLLGALRILQDRGHALLVQEHDFAEDFRPGAYDPFWPYPGSCDYATINSRDRDNLVAAGLDPRHVHLLPNPVSDPDDFSPRLDGRAEVAGGRRTALYPVRAIRRKNIGEALLLSRFLPPGAELAVTLPPTSPEDFGRYLAWKAFATEGSWQVRFEAGKDSQLPELFEGSFAAVTTSVKEGFGYSYLDPLMRGLPVLGREIPHVVRDFAEEGVALAGLYGELRVPVQALEAEALRGAVRSRLGRFRKAFRPAFGQDGKPRLASLLEGLCRRFEGETVDFGALDEGLQASILGRLGRDRGLTAELLGLSPFLEGIFERAPSPEEAKRRRDAVVEGYSEKAYGPRLASIYAAAVAGQARGTIDKALLVERFLEPSGFFLSAS
jgi:glycosyltransferase involved in cell wall biosynthesis